jgi:DNA-binding NarL/FixJ family response regulator
LHCEEITHAVDFAALCKVADPDTAMIVIDSELPGFDSPEQLDELRAKASRAKQVILSAQFGTDSFLPLANAGVDGFIPKQLNETELIEAFRLIAGGIVYLPSDLWKEFASGGVQPAPASSSDTPLSARQEEVLVLASKGYSNKEIGAESLAQPQVVARPANDHGPPCRLPELKCECARPRVTPPDRFGAEFETARPRAL